jgi:hypothetical protein
VRPVLDPASGRVRGRRHLRDQPAVGRRTDQLKLDAADRDGWLRADAGGREAGAGDRDLPGAMPSTIRLGTAERTVGAAVCAAALFARYEPALTPISPISVPGIVGKPCSTCARNAVRKYRTAITLNTTHCRSPSEGDRLCCCRRRC